MLQEPLLAAEPAAIAGQAAVRADDAVAGHDDADRVLAVGQADCAHRLGLADAAGQFGVADRAAALDARQRPPHAFLEGGARGLHRQRFDHLEVSVEIAPHGARQPAGVARGLQGIAPLAVLAIEQLLHAGFVVGPVDGAQIAVAIGDDDQLADRGGDAVDQEFKHVRPSSGVVRHRRARGATPAAPWYRDLRAAGRDPNRPARAGRAAWRSAARAWDRAPGACRW